MVHAYELRAQFLESGDKTFQHQHPMAASNDVRMTGVGDNAPICAAGHVNKVVNPVLHHAVCVAMTGPGTGHLEMGMVVLGPADRHFDQRSFITKLHRLL